MAGFVPCIHSVSPVPVPPLSLQLASRLPARVQGYLWRLAYSSQNHGTSLKTLYRNLLELDSPVLLVLKDMDNQVRGRARRNARDNRVGRFSCMVFEIRVDGQLQGE